MLTYKTILILTRNITCSKENSKEMEINRCNRSSKASTRCSKVELKVFVTTVLYTSVYIRYLQCDVIKGNIAVLRAVTHTFCNSDASQLSNHRPSEILASSA